MCSSNEQYIIKLCRFQILDIIKNLLNSDNININESATILLGHIVCEYVTPTKAFTKGDQFEISIRQSLLGPDFIPKLVQLISRACHSESLLKACFWCLSQYTSEINLSSDDCMAILYTINIVLNSTVYRSSVFLMRRMIMI